MRRLILVIALVASVEPARAKSQHLGRVKSSPVYTVLLVLDGARPSYFGMKSLTHINWLAQHGVTYTHAFVGQELANTPPSHATIGTGVFPRHHGIEGFWWKDSRTQTLTRPTDNQDVQNDSLGSIIAANKAPSLAEAIKLHDRHATVVAVSGHKCYAAEAMGTAKADYILCAMIYHGRWVAQAVHNHQPPPGAVNNPHWDVPIPPPTSGIGPAVQQWKVTQENDWTTRYALWAFHRVHYPRLLMVNLPETDVMGHFTGVSRPTMQEIMRGVDRDVGSIIEAYRSAGLLQHTVFMITADHGMSTVDTRLPFEVLDRAVALAGATKVYLEADTAAAIGIREPNKARAVARNVSVLGGDLIDATYFKSMRHGQWVYTEESMRPDFPFQMKRALDSLAATVASADGPDVLVFYAPHVTTGDRIVRKYHWLAGHLGPQWDDQHIPLIVSGDGVRQGVSSPYPARLVDVAPTIERLTHAPVLRSDGVVLADALRAPSPVERRRQEGIGHVLLQEVEALIQRSGAPQN